MSGSFGERSLGEREIWRSALHPLTPSPVDAHLKAQREYLAKEERLAQLELQLAYLELEVLVAARRL